MSDRITGISSMATRQVLAELAAAYQQRSGHRRRHRIGGRRRCRQAGPGRRALRRRGAGLRCDRQARSPRAASSPAARSTWCTRASRSRCAPARRGPISAPKPRCAQAVLAARTHRLFDRTERRGAARSCSSAGASPKTISERIVQAPPGVPVGALVARGEVELGFQQLSELMHLEGIDVIGPMPAGAADRHHLLRRRLRRFGAGRGRARSCSTSWPRPRPPRPSGATAWSRPEQHRRPPRKRT